jgi:hypothetical protein
LPLSSLITTIDFDPIYSKVPDVTAAIREALEQLSDAQKIGAKYRNRHELLQTLQREVKPTTLEEQCGQFDASAFPVDKAFLEGLPSSQARTFVNDGVVAAAINCADSFFRPLCGTKQNKTRFPRPVSIHAVVASTSQP